MAGFTDNYLRVEVPAADPSLDNKIIGVRIDSVDAANETLAGTPA